MVLESCNHEWERTETKHGIQRVCKFCGVDSFTMKPIVVCQCKGCREERNSLQKQLEHPFYKKVDAFRAEVKHEALEKAATKYKEPFNPKSWSVRQLGKHAMSENYDQGNYIVGLMEVAEDLEQENEKLKQEIEKLKQELESARNESEYWRLRGKREHEKWSQKETR